MTMQRSRNANILTAFLNIFTLISITYYLNMDLL